MVDTPKPSARARLRAGAVHQADAMTEVIADKVADLLLPLIKDELGRIRLAAEDAKAIAGAISAKLHKTEIPPQKKSTRKPRRKNAPKPQAIKPKICTVDECEKEILARGLCSKHYYHWRKRQQK